jgi:AraC-like DNA-binding protein
MSQEHDLTSAPVDDSSANHSSAGPDSSLTMDTLSDVLREVRLAGSVFFLVDALTPWVAAAPHAQTLLPAVVPHAQHLVSYHVIRQGRCWCRMGNDPPTLLEAGDVLVVPHGDAYALSSDPHLESSWSDEATLEWFRDMSAGRTPFVVSEGGEGPDRLEIVCGFLGCDTLPFNPVLSGLPRLLRVRLQPDQAGNRLNQLIEYAVGEARDRLAGGRCVLLRLSELMFVELLRQYLLGTPATHTGWLAALSDPIIGRALEQLHRNPSEEWSLDTLARRSATSRSVLSERFTHFLGEPPMQYLARWRMHLAAQRLRDSNAKVSAISLEVGYQSEASFSRAFKKIVGVSPAAWRSSTPRAF